MESVDVLTLGVEDAMISLVLIVFCQSSVDGKKLEGGGRDSLRHVI